MKKTIKSFFVGITAISILGCSNQPEPIQTIKTKKTYSQGTGKYYISMPLVWDISTGTEIANTATVLREGALLLKEEGFTHFSLRLPNNKENVIHDTITNMRDLADYCYPSHKSVSSLEDKCHFTSYRYGAISLYFTGRTEPKKDRFLWSVDQVLNDPIVNKYREEALSSYENKKITFEEVKSKRLMINFKR